MTLPFREWRRLTRRALSAQRRDQSEVCGLLGVDMRGAVFLYFGRNQAGPGSWQLSGAEIERIEKTIEEDGRKAIGTFHSHPISEPIPGERDKAAMNFAEGYQLIYDVCGNEAKLWQRGDGPQIREVPLQTNKSPNKGRLTRMARD